MFIVSTVFKKSYGKVQCVRGLIADLLADRGLLKTVYFKSVYIYMALTMGYLTFLSCMACLFKHSDMSLVQSTKVSRTAID